jgi:hypothetical protein
VSDFSTTLAIDDLRRALSRVLDDTARLLGDRVQLGGGLYWQVPADQLRAMHADGIDLDAGDLDDDVETMRGYLADAAPSRAPWHELNHLVGILRALEVLAMPEARRSK